MTKSFYLFHIFLWSLPKKRKLETLHETSMNFISILGKNCGCRVRSSIPENLQALFSSHLRLILFIFLWYHFGCLSLELICYRWHIFFCCDIVLYIIHCLSLTSKDWNYQTLSFGDWGYLKDKYICFKASYMNL